MFLPQTHTDAHRQISENGIRHICRKYAAKNQKVDCYTYFDSELIDVYDYADILEGLLIPEENE